MNQEPNAELWKLWLGQARATSYLAAFPQLSLEEVALWNQRISGSLMTDIGHLEVGLRNTISRVLAAKSESLGSGVDWLSDTSRFFARMGGTEFNAKVLQARQQASKTKKDPTFDDLIAELSLGFWLNFLAKRYLPIHADLASAFSGLGDRNIRKLPPIGARVRLLRNRLAHHHRILHRNLSRDWMDVLYLARAVDPRLAEFIVQASLTPSWIEEFNRIAQAGSSPSPHVPR